MASAAVTSAGPATSSRRSSVNQDQKRRNSSAKCPEILRLDDAMLIEKEREIKVATALRLIREVAQARSKSSIDLKKKRSEAIFFSINEIIIHGPGRLILSLMSLSSSFTMSNQ
jgi:hypothetical protein